MLWIGARGRTVDVTFFSIFFIRAYVEGELITYAVAKDCDFTILL